MAFGLSEHSSIEIINEDFVSRNLSKNISLSIASSKIVILPNQI